MKSRYDENGSGQSIMFSLVSNCVEIKQSPTVTLRHCGSSLYGLIKWAKTDGQQFVNLVMFEFNQDCETIVLFAKNLIAEHKIPRTSGSYCVSFNDEAKSA
jgi:hypothetical protein